MVLYLMTNATGAKTDKESEEDKHSRTLFGALTFSLSDLHLRLHTTNNCPTKISSFLEIDMSPPRAATAYFCSFGFGITNYTLQFIEAFVGYHRAAVHGSNISFIRRREHRTERSV
jgi:hypothetical protein